MSVILLKTQGVDMVGNLELLGRVFQDKRAHALLERMTKMTSWMQMPSYIFTLYDAGYVS